MPAMPPRSLEKRRGRQHLPTQQSRVSAAQAAHTQQGMALPHHIAFMRTKLGFCEEHPALLTTLSRTGHSLSPGVKQRGFGCVHITQLLVLGLQHVEALWS